MIAPPAKCRGCHKPIRWAKTEHGKNIPLDPDPVPDGNIVVTDAGIAHVLRSTEMATAPTYVSHFSTCPKRAHFRRQLRSVGTRKGASS
jgi:hypothetical protein